MTSRHPPASHIAGVLAAQEGRIPSHELAAAIVDRLAREGFVIVPRDQGAAVAALQGIDGILGLRDAAADEDLVTEWAGQLGMDDPSPLASALAAVRDVLDGPRNADLAA
jgi:hypothetical protein